MSEKFNTRVERFKLNDGSVHERRTEIKRDGSLGIVRGSEVILGLTDEQISMAGIIKILD